MQSLRNVGKLIFTFDKQDFFSISKKMMEIVKMWWLHARIPSTSFNVLVMWLQNRVRRSCKCWPNSSKTTLRTDYKRIDSSDFRFIMILAIILSSRRLCLLMTNNYWYHKKHCNFQDTKNEPSDNQNRSCISLMMKIMTTTVIKGMRACLVNKWESQDRVSRSSLMLSRWCFDCFA